jgi:hypothetical protein
MVAELEHLAENGHRARITRFVRDDFERASQR